MPGPYECDECRDSGFRALRVEEDDANPIGFINDLGEWKQSFQRVPVMSSQARAKFGDAVDGLPLSLHFNGRPLRIELCTCVRKALRKYL